MEELAQILGEELALPRIEPKGKKNIVATKDKYTGIRQAGPESLRHFKRTFKKALKRQISSGIYDPSRPLVVPIREDKLYRSWKEIPKPESVACIIYMMDVSGSMTDEQKEIVRIEAFWIDAWIKAHYNGIETVYIIHDAAAQEVDEHTFYHTRESGGTKISTAYELADKSRRSCSTWTALWRTPGRESRPASATCWRNWATTRRWLATCPGRSVRRSAVSVGTLLGEIR